MHSQSNFQQKLQLIEQDFQDILGRIHELQNEYAQSHEEFSHCHLENQTLSNQVNQLHLQLSKSQTENQTLSNQVYQLQNELSILQKENPELRSQINRPKDSNTEIINLTNKLNFFQDAYNNFKFEDILISLIQENNFYGFIFYLKKFFFKLYQLDFHFPLVYFLKIIQNNFHNSFLCC
jgi:chromosome segregation ATPase